MTYKISEIVHVEAKDMSMGPADGLVCPNCGKERHPGGSFVCDRARHPVTGKYLVWDYGAIALNPEWGPNRRSM